MWLLRFQNIKWWDYWKITRLCKKSGFCPKKFSATILVKWILIHILLKKSWRKIAEQIWIPYLPIYQFYKKIEDKPELIDMLNYFCEKKVISYIWDKKDITRDFLESEQLIEQSLNKIKEIKKY
jgi:hypothetical protein